VSEPAVVSQALAVRALGVSKVYGSDATAVRALDDLSIEVPEAGFTAIMGPSGSGKSTLLHCLAGLDRPTAGQIFLGDVEITARSENELTLIRRDEIGFVFQAFNLIPMLDAAENITLPLSLAGRTADEAWLSRVIKTVRLGDRLDHRPDQLSGGEQQRVAVARALVTRPKVIFADEPTGNLDSRSGAEILAFMREAVDDLGQTVVMVSHDPVAASYADRAVFLADGRIVDEMTQPTPEAILDRMKQLGA
jgi:putative ABC transport system ATP-binding protein